MKTDRSFFPIEPMGDLTVKYSRFQRMMSSLISIRCTAKNNIIDAVQVE